MIDFAMYNGRCKRPEEMKKFLTIAFKYSDNFIKGKDDTEYDSYFKVTSFESESF